MMQPTRTAAAAAANGRTEALRRTPATRCTTTSRSSRRCVFRPSCSSTNQCQQHQCQQHQPAQQLPSERPPAAATSRRSLLHAAAWTLAAAMGTQARPVLADVQGLSSSGITTVFVAGATGQTGQRVVQQLQAKGYKVRAGIRDVAKAQKLGLDLLPGVTLVQADVTKGVKQLREAIGDAQAVVCATGGILLTSGPVDEQGTINLVDAAKEAGAGKFVLVSSLLTNAPGVGQADNPNYKFLNLFGGVLDHKLVAERYLRASGLDFTIVRPGGLSNEVPQEVGNLIVRPEDTLLGLDTDPGRVISRDTVAAVAIEALTQPSASNKVFEIVSSPTAPALTPDKWFVI